MYTIPATYQEELIRYRKLVNRANAQEKEDVQFKIFRVVRGIYEQRKRGTYMVRIRCAAGMISPGQLYLVANLAELYGSDFLHITTRQEIQLHNLQLSDTPHILEELFKMGLTTKGSGGNTVRNITASPESGISGEEAFDVTPYNIALTDFLLRRPESFDLPRKLKIAFSASENDTALAAFNDLGFLAKLKNGEKGFKVFLGGSPSVKPMVGEVLFDFLPADKIFGVALAVIEMFNAHGNRKNRHQARLRYLFYKLGKEKVFELFREKYNRLQSNEFPNIPEVQPKHHIPAKISLGKLTGNGLEKWAKDFVSAQRQENLCTIEIPVMHGNLKIHQAKALARFAGHFGDDTLRFSRKQNLHLRNIPKPFLGILYKTLRSSGLSTDIPLLLSNLVSCTGADTCQLGICFSKGGLQALHDRISESTMLHNLKNVGINISGCPNSCGQHLVADLGFAGRVSRKDRIYPSYNVFAGAVTENGKATLPIKIGEVAAKDLPEFTHDLLTLYHQSWPEKSFRAFIESSMKDVQAILDCYKNIPAYEDNRKYYIDWGNNDLFTLEARGTGECSAGLLDLIESETRVIRKCRESFSGQQQIEEQTVLLHEMALSASKLLCLTIQKPITDHGELFELVNREFIRRNKIQNSYAEIFQNIIDGNFAALIRQKKLVLDYAEAAEDYYRQLDDSLTLTSAVQEITAGQLKELIARGADIQLIDVREPWEKEIADIGGMLIPLGQIGINSGKIPTDIQTVIYCRTGRRSAEAIEILAEKRNTGNLFNLRGGIHAWVDEVDDTIQKY